MRRLVSEIIWDGRVDDRIVAGDRVALLAPHPDAGRTGIVRLVDIGGAFVQLLGERRCFIWAGASSLAKQQRIAGRRQAPQVPQATRPRPDHTPSTPGTAD